MPIYMYVDGVMGSLISPPKHMEVAARQTMQRIGVSQLGVDQFPKGQVVVNLADRSKLASLLVRSLHLELENTLITN
jgi:hypothetical protein